MDIVKRIDEILNEIELHGKYKCISKETALKILEEISEEIPDDKCLIETVQLYVEKDWKPSNVQLIERFYKMMAYYGVVEQEDVSRKTVLEAKGKTIVRKFISLENKEYIKSLLE